MRNDRSAGKPPQRTQLKLTDEETFALLNLLIDTIEGDRDPLSPRIRMLRSIRLQ